MKIIVPEFVLPALQAETCALVKTCDFVVINQAGEFSKDIAGVEVVMLPFGLTSSALQAILEQPTLRWIHSVSAGVDHAIGGSLTAHPAILTNARGIFDGPIAEMVLGYMLMATKKMPIFMEQQRKHLWQRHNLREMQGLSVGIVGLGSIGSEIARRCHAFDMRLLATRRHPELGGEHIDQMLPQSKLDVLLENSDFVVLATPLTPETRGMIGREQLLKMRPSAWLVNIARGPIVVEEALVHALKEKWIAGATLDVFSEEPLPANSPLWDFSNVIITPHNSWSTPHLKEREATLFLDNLQRYLRDQKLLNVVNKKKGY